MTGLPADIRAHIDRYNDPGLLAAHLHAGTHQREVPAGDENDLGRLYAHHETAHREALAAAPVAVRAGSGDQ